MQNNHFIKKWLPVTGIRLVVGYGAMSDKVFDMFG